jgi:transposase
MPSCACDHDVERRILRDRVQLVFSGIRLQEDVSILGAARSVLLHADWSSRVAAWILVAEAIRGGLRARHIVPRLAMRRTAHGSGLGRWRWVVERTFAWLSRFRRLRVRDERLAEIHLAFLTLGCALICLDYWLNRF